MPLVLDAAPWRTPTVTGVDRPEVVRLTEATGVTAAFKVDGPASVQFAIDADTEAVADIFGDNLEGDTHDTVAWWQYDENSDSQQLLRGRIPDPTINAGATNAALSVQALDDRGLLGRIPIETAPRFVGKPPQQIVWDLITARQALTNGNLNITRGMYDAAGSADRTDWPAGKWIADAINELARDWGFDWGIGPDKVLNCWTGGRGTVKLERELSYPGSLDSISGALGDIDGRPNVVIATGDQTTTPVIASGATVSTDPRGRVTAVVASPNTSLQQTLVERAPAVLKEMERGGPDLTVTLLPGEWRGPSDIWIGDTLTVNYTVGTIYQEAPMRVMELTIADDGSGSDNVQMRLANAT